MENRVVVHRGPQRVLQLAGTTVFMPTKQQNVSVRLLRLRRTFSWRFVVADISSPILGVDFLDHYRLLVDLQSRSLIDPVTLLRFS